MSFLLAAAAFFVSLMLTRRFCDPASCFHILDRPNDRSLHTQPTPRSGGLAILAAVYVCGAAAVYWLGHPLDVAYAWVGGTSLLVAGVSYFDDRFSLPSGIRIVVHILAATLLISSGLVMSRLELPGLDLWLPFWIGVVVTLLYIVWMLNLYNFMDGMDGFAGGMTVIGFGAFALLGWQAGNIPFMLLNLVTTAAGAGFLVFNFPPARIFMGDVGSSTLGLLAAAFSLWGARDAVFPFWIALLIFSPFIADATVTLFQRLWRREKIWQAHKTHYYQRLAQAGWGHRKTVLLEYTIMLACGASALWGVRAPGKQQAVILAGWALFYLFFFAWVSRRVPRSDKTGRA
ncbi:MAG: MraY family glycosyltransferase [Sulfuricaulis sp.]